MQVQSRATVPAQGRGEHCQTWGCLRREYSVVNHGGPGSVFTLATWQWLRTRSICVAAGGPSSVCPETDGWVPPQGPLVTWFPRPSEPVCSAAEGRFPSPNSGRVGAVDLGSPSLSWSCLSLQLGEVGIPEPPAGSCSRGLDALESRAALWSGCWKNRAALSPTVSWGRLCSPRGRTGCASRKGRPSKLAEPGPPPNQAKSALLGESGGGGTSPGSRRSRAPSSTPGLWVARACEGRGLGCGCAGGGARWGPS